MPIPWLRILDAVLGVTNLALTNRLARRDSEGESRLAHGDPTQGHLESRLAGVVVAALKEAFDRDSRRLEFEREQAEVERKRAERALRLELLRQAGDRELGRLRLLAGVALVSWLASLLLAGRALDGSASIRVVLGAGWAVLLGALACTLFGYTNLGRELARTNPATDRDPDRLNTDAGTVASWLIVVGLALIGLAVLAAR